MKIVKNQEKIEIAELKEISKKMFGSFVKAVVDIEKNIMAVDAELHIDLEQLLIEKENCEPKNLWGINIYTEIGGVDRIEFDSMINLKPAWDNKTRGVESKEIQDKIIKITEKFITP